MTDRRNWLRSSACGFGSLALSGLLADAEPAAATTSSPSLAERSSVIVQRAKRMIFLFMQGGPSHVDTFDHKPVLIRAHDSTIDFTGVRFGTFGKVSQRRLMRPLWRFRRHGECGQPISELFPEIARQADELCFLHGMHTEGVAHGPSTLFLHTGATNLVRPSLGSWLMFGLGNENQNLPGFVSLQPSQSNGGPRNYSSAFLPAVYQGSPIGRAGLPVDQMTIGHLHSKRPDAVEERRRFDLIQSLNLAHVRRRSDTDNRLEAVIRSHELAWRMQATAPEILDISRESGTSQAMYGIGRKPTDAFGRQCLVARRLSEAGVRFVQVNYADNSPNPRWDQHSNMPRHAVHARATDLPVAGLLSDLKQRGLLDETLVWWGGEFGRTPFSQNGNGRDHNPRGFTVFLAGGGVKPGFRYGATDDIGHVAVDSRIHMHDLHASILHLMGIDHKRLTWRHAGREFRLTDVYGRVVHEIMA